MVHRIDSRRAIVRADRRGKENCWQEIPFFGCWTVAVLGVHNLKPNAWVNRYLMTGGAYITVGQWLKKVTRSMNRLTGASLMGACLELVFFCFFDRGFQPRRV